VATLLLIRHGQASYGEADYDRLSARGVAQAEALGAYLKTLRLDAVFHGPLRRQRETAEFAGLVGSVIERSGSAGPRSPAEGQGGVVIERSGSAGPRSPAEGQGGVVIERSGSAGPRSPAEGQGGVVIERSGSAGPRSPAEGQGGVVIDELAEYPAFEMLQHLVPKLVAEDAKFAALTTAPTPRLLDDAFHTVLSKWGRDEWYADGVERVGAFVARVQRGLERAIAAAGRGGRVAVVTSAGPIGVAVGLVFGLPAERMIRTSIAIRNASISELRFRSNGFDWQADKVTLVTFNTTGHLPAEMHTER
jgi:broad specificity phosphatase PhoE